jgi:Fe-S cluster biogenesis protein NfuA
MTTLDAREFQSRLERLDALLREAERSPDLGARGRTQELLRAVLDVHAAGLQRLLEHVTAAGDAGRAIVDACARDDVVGGLLLLHGLHPLDVEARVRQALERVRPYLRSHGGNVELLRVEDGVVRLRLQGSCHSCPSSAATMQHTVEEAIYGRAPEVTAVEVEGVADVTPARDVDRPRVALPLV